MIQSSKKVINRRGSVFMEHVYVYKDNIAIIFGTVHIIFAT